LLLGLAAKMAEEPFKWGGARLDVPPGRWLTGSFNLTSRFTLFGPVREVWASVEEFGAMGDGATPNTAAFRRAVVELGVRATGGGGARLDVPLGRSTASPDAPTPRLRVTTPPLLVRFARRTAPAPLTPTVAPLHAINVLPTSPTSARTS
jgi:hypothetical protein